MDDHNEWLIWSNEHRAWWKPQGWGYTTLTHLAGRYAAKEAEDICRCANIAVRAGSLPNEIMVLAPPRDRCHMEMEEYR